MSWKEGGEVRMDGWDMVEVEVYKEKKEHLENDQNTGIKKEISIKEKKKGKREEWTV